MAQGLSMGAVSSYTLYSAGRSVPLCLLDRRGVLRIGHGTSRKAQGFVRVWRQGNPALAPVLVQQKPSGPTQSAQTSNPLLQDELRGRAFMGKT